MDLQTLYTLKKKKRVGHSFTESAYSGCQIVLISKERQGRDFVYKQSRGRGP